MKVVFAGTPVFAVTALAAILKSQHQVVAVYTQPDRPRGRGLKLAASPVKEFADKQGIPVLQPANLKDQDTVATLKQWQADAIVVAAYGLLLPIDVLRMPQYGCLNIHPSLLPRFRGAAPIPRTIESGDSISGVTIMQMDQGLDTGPILLQREYVLDPVETAQTLHDKLANLGAACMVEALDLIERKVITYTAQNNELATYAHKISKEEALLDWSRDAEALALQIRAFNPWPVCYTTWQGKNLRIWDAKVLHNSAQHAPRTLLQASDKGIDIATGKGILRLLKVQLPGAKPVPIADFYHAQQKSLRSGEHFI